jgi:hypothetical protein
VLDVSGNFPRGMLIEPGSGRSWEGMIGAILGGWD